MFLSGVPPGDWEEETARAGSCAPPWGSWPGHPAVKSQALNQLSLQHCLEDEYSGPPTPGL